MPAHDPFRVEVLIRQVFVVCVDYNLLSQKNVAELLESLHYTEQFSFSCRGSRLLGLELTTIECNRLALLHNDCAQLHVTGISMDDEFFVKIWVGQQRFLADDPLHVVERLLMFLGPFPLHCLGRELGQRS